MFAKINIIGADKYMIIIKRLVHCYCINVMILIIELILTPNVLHFIARYNL